MLFRVKMLLVNVKSAHFFSDLFSLFQAAYGGGGRGMRVVTRLEDVVDQFERARSEAVKAFGNGEIFIERLVEHPRHIEVIATLMRLS